MQKQWRSCWWKWKPIQKCPSTSDLHFVSPLLPYIHCLLHYTPHSCKPQWNTHSLTTMQMQSILPFLYYVNSCFTRRDFAAMFYRQQEEVLASAQKPQWWWCCWVLSQSCGFVITSAIHHVHWRYRLLPMLGIYIYLCAWKPTQWFLIRLLFISLKKSEEVTMDLLYCDPLLTFGWCPLMSGYMYLKAQSNLDSDMT